MVTNKRAKWLHSLTREEIERRMRETINIRCRKRIKLFKEYDLSNELYVEFMDETKLIKSVFIKFKVFDPVSLKIGSENYKRLSHCVADKYYSYIRTRIEEMLQVYNKIYSKGIYREKYLKSIKSQLQFGDGIEIRVEYV